MYICRICCGAIFAIWTIFAPSLMSSALAQGEMFFPRWEVGDQWTVKLVYPHPTRENVWSPPMHWTYRVSAEEGNRFVVSVLNPQGVLQVRLSYSQSDYVILGVELVKQQRGVSSVVTLDFQSPAPVLTSQSAAPFDTPVFPLRPGTSTEFLVQKRVDDQLKAVEKVVQTVRKLIANPPELPGPVPAGTLEVVSQRADGVQLFRQYWSPQHPWPLYGENRNMRYWLSLP